MSYAAEAKQTYTVELPCKAGTKVFFLDKTNLRVIDCQVSAISAQWVEHNDKMFLSMRVSGIKENYITDCIPEHLGEILFFTRAEADAALEALQKELQGKHCDSCASLGAHYNRLVKDQILCHRCTLRSMVLDNPANQVCGEYQKRKETQ